MVIIAFRPEYQLTVDAAKNRIFYQNFDRMQWATALPHYEADWTAALAEVKAGFCILSDMQVVNQVNPLVPRPEFLAVERLIVAHGVRMVAEIHVPGLPARRHSDVITTSLAMPVRQFLSLWEADQFLDDL